jgi:hypothetical protein
MNNNSMIQSGMTDRGFTVDKLIIKFRIRTTHRLLAKHCNAHILRAGMLDDMNLLGSPMFIPAPYICVVLDLQSLLFSYKNTADKQALCLF